MDLDVQGEWWLPGHESGKIYGVLKVAKGEAGRLELSGAFRSFFDSVAWNEKEDDGSRSGVVSLASMRDAGTYPTILGKSEVEGKYYTLKDCWSSRSGSKGRSAKRSESVGVNQVVEGILFDEPDEEIQFDGCRISMRHLPIWVGRSGLKVSYPSNPETFATIEAVNLKDLKADLKDKSTISFRQSLGTNGDGIHSAAIEQSCILVWDFPSLRKPEEITSAVGDVQDLVSIGCNRPAEFESVVMVHPQAPVTTMSGRILPGREPIRYYGQWLIKDRKQGSPKQHNLLFTLDDVGGMPGIENWIAVARKNQTALARVMSTLYGDGLYIQDKLTNCLASLEWLDANRKQDNVKDYAVRLRRSVTLAGPQFEEIIGDIDKWVKLALEYRNDLMHHYDKLFRNSTATLYPVSQSVYWLFVLCMFRMAGFPDALFAKISAHQDLTWLRAEMRRILA